MNLRKIMLKKKSEIIDNEIKNDNEEKDNDLAKMEEILKKKEEIDKWIIEKAKNGSKTNEKLSIEIAELKKRIEKLESILRKIDGAFK